MRLKTIAQETVAALERGSYTASNGATIDLAALMRPCLDETRCYTADALEGIRDSVLATMPPHDHTLFELANESTLQGAARLAASGTYAQIGVLNFASAKNPGGGFLRGAQAQEESLARSSGLYLSLLRCPEYYAHHRREKTLLYSDRMIFSPNCPIIRDDFGVWINEPLIVSFITSPAPNYGAVRSNEPENLDQIPRVLDQRMGKLLALAVDHGCDALVLGAWGCGVFRNDPQLVASLFRSHLRGAFYGRFRCVVFSVLDRTTQQKTYRAFEQVMV